MSRRAMIIAGLLATAVIGEAQPSCPGDCNGDGVVPVNELISAVGISLETTTLDACPAADANGDDQVSINELIQAVNANLVGCFATPTHTPTRTRTPDRTVPATTTRTPTPTASPTPSRTAPPTPQLGGVDVVEGATDAALGNTDGVRVLIFGCVAADACARGDDAANAVFRLAAPKRRAAVPRGVPADCSPRTESCELGGSRTVTCADSTLTVRYASCIEALLADHEVERDGTIVQTVSAPDFCTTCTVDALTDTVTLDQRDFTLTERDGNEAIVTRLEADATDTFAPLRLGCVQPDGTELIDGTQTIAGRVSLQCEPSAQSIECPGSQPDLAWTTDALTIVRQSGGFPCELGLTLTGTVDVDDRAGQAAYAQAFEPDDDRAGFLITETKLADGASRFTQTGLLNVDCLGPLAFTTVVEEPSTQAGAILVPEGAACPSDGRLEVARPPFAAIGEGIAVNAAARGIGEAEQELDADLLRASNGQVYLVIQNRGAEADLGADAVQITTLAGAADGSVGACANTAGATADPQAVAAVEAGKAFPPSAVFKSDLLPFTAPLVFNRNGAGGNGRVCLGPDCTGSAACPDAGACVTFSIGDGRPITEASTDIPAAALVESLAPLADPCSGFAGRSTYRFGPGDPTTEIRQCETLPAPPAGDGFRLPNGETVVFAFDTSFAALFNAAVAGFPVNVVAIDPENQIGCDGTSDQALQLGLATLDSVPPPRINFADGGVLFDYDADDVIDKPVASCTQVTTLSACQ